MGGVDCASHRIRQGSSGECQDDIGISFNEFTQRLFEEELNTTMPGGGIDSICGMVKGTPFDMTSDSEQILAETTKSLLVDGHY